MWTDFYLATLENKCDVQRFEMDSVYKIIDTVNPKSMSRDDMLALNAKAKFVEIPFSADSADTTIQVQLARESIGTPAILFRKPIVVEVMGAGFDKNSGSDHYILRFPRLIKVHLDRGTEDVVTFKELQTMADSSIAAGSDGDAEKDAD